MAESLMDDLQALLCLARIIELGSFTKAAAALGVSKSVVSGKVAALEVRLGEQLLLRTTRQVTATEAGLRTYTYARQMTESAAAATKGSTDAGRGILRVSAPVTLGQLHLAKPIAAFLARAPGTRVELLLNDRLVDLVDERVDVALRITKLKDSSLIARRLAKSSFVICASPRYLAARGRPERPEDLLRHDCLRYSLLRADHEWRLYGKKGRIPLDVTGSFETTNGTMMREAAIAGVGITILPRFMVADALAAGLLETLLTEFAPRPLGIYAVRSGRPAAPRLITQLVHEIEVAFRAADW